MGQIRTLMHSHAKLYRILREIYSFEAESDVEYIWILVSYGLVNFYDDIKFSNETFLFIYY